LGLVWVIMEKYFNIRKDKGVSPDVIWVMEYVCGLA
jgi:hypothetical protein